MSGSGGTGFGVVVIGAGGHAKVVLATLAAAGVTVSRVLDDDPGLFGTTLMGIPVDGPVVLLAEMPARRAVLAVGSNQARQRIADELTVAIPGLTWTSVVHPSAVVHPSVVVGPGAVVLAGAVVQPDSELGTHAIVNTGASVDHDCTVGDFAHLAPGVRLAGGVMVGEGAFLGIGAVAIPGVSVGRWAVVGAGAAVVDDVASGATVAGVPARPLGDGRGDDAP